MTLGDTDPKPSVCTICKKQILKGALKCTECDSYQRSAPRIASFLAPILSSLISVPVSLIAIGTALYSIAAVELTAADSKMDYSFQNAENGFIIVGYNSGSRPATFGKIQLAVPENKQIELTEKNNAPISIEPGKDIFISLAPPVEFQSTSSQRPSWANFHKPFDVAKCSITFFGTKFSGDPDQIGPKQFDCNRIACWFYRQQWPSQSTAGRITCDSG